MPFKPLVCFSVADTCRVLTEKERKPTPLPIHHIPVTISFGITESGIPLLDPSDREEEVCKSRLTKIEHGMDHFLGQFDIIVPCAQTVEHGIPEPHVFVRPTVRRTPSGRNLSLRGIYLGFKLRPRFDRCAAGRFRNTVRNGSFPPDVVEMKQPLLMAKNFFVKSVYLYLALV